MNMRSLCAALIATTAAALTLPAQAQTMTAQPLPQVQAAPPAASGRLTARTIDLRPIPSRISHGVVSVRNTGTSASVASVITVNCHRPGQTGGCVDIPPAYIAQYTNAAYPNRLVVNVPVIQPGHVYNHNLPFWDEMDWPSGQEFIFEFAADAGGTNNETNEANNAGVYNWIAP
ncbi:hypothetical protein [Terricaulis silvestris]|uniref:CARDB domain-containing protein n=1 Tax=Terricaulis silvestris TaxID=2686094 RepID=A0A6I6MHP8_9CAUL|nr:hypothetical protein [Terricaulis silvestris]QGZ93959.1 hypothetical protein DSM104635_00774 [Terricaulis silvestris]